MSSNLLGTILYPPSQPGVLGWARRLVFDPDDRRQPCLRASAVQPCRGAGPIPARG